MFQVGCDRGNSTRRPKFFRFTVLELLVVIVIITILATLLLPALSRSRYKNKLTVCVGNLRQMGLSIHQYAMSYDDFYPRRGVSHDEGWYANTARRLTEDDRPLLNEAFDVEKMLVCPLAPPIPSTGDVMTTAATTVYANYEMRFGSLMNWNLASTGLYRVGDVAKMQVGASNFRFRVLVADAERSWEDGPDHQLVTGHPELEGPGILKPFVQDTASVFVNNYATDLGGGSLPANVRGKIDRNFLFDDGSVKTYWKLAFRDGRLTRVPAQPRNTAKLVYNYLPDDPIK